MPNVSDKLCYVSDKLCPMSLIGVMVPPCFIPPVATARIQFKMADASETATSFCASVRSEVVKFRVVPEFTDTVVGGGGGAQFFSLLARSIVLTKRLARALFVLLLSTLVLSANRVVLGFFCFINFPIYTPHTPRFRMSPTNLQTPRTGASPFFLSTYRR